MVDVSLPLEENMEDETIKKQFGADMIVFDAGSFTHELKCKRCEASFPNDVKKCCNGNEQCVYTKKVIGKDKCEFKS